MKKYMNYLFKGLAIFGGLVMLAIIWRSKKASETQSVKFTDAVQNDVKRTTDFGGGMAVVILPLIASMALLFSGHAAEGMMMANLWGSIAASASGSFNITYVPQFIGFSITSAPTSFQINVQGDGIIFNLDATGSTNMNGIRYLGVIANQYVFQIADGLINGKNGSVTITNAAAAQLDIYQWNKQPGSFYFTYLTQQALASSGVVVKDFAYLAMPSIAAADPLTIEYATGITQVSNRLDIGFALGYKQNVSAIRYAIDNIAPSTVKQVTLNPAAAQNVYAMTYQSQKGTVSSSLISK
jgi:hypothetical protein